MAGSTKEYELLFLMKAQVDASMRQFSVVGGQVKGLEEKIQQYNNTLKTIDGYRTQETATAGLEEKLRALEAGTAEVNRRFNEATAATTAARAEVKEHQAAIDALSIALKTEAGNTEENRVKLEQEKIARRESKTALQEAIVAEKEAAAAKNGHQKQIDDLRGKLGEELQKLREVSEALKRAGVDTRDLEAAEKRLRTETGELRKEQEKWANIGNVLMGLNNQFSTMRMAATAVMGPVRKVLEFYRESMDAAATLEYSMSAVEAISGAAEEETRRMTAVVKEMGATTVYTAEEAAGAMEKMALAGWETEQMIAGLPAVVKLAAAAGEDLAEMTSIVSDGMNAFHLTGERAAVKFADVLAKAATSSNTTVALLGQSLSYVETTAGNLGYSIEDVSLALAALANNALKGGAAGTALNTLLTRMSGANETAAKQMKEMGLSMYDTNGVAKGLLTFLGELRGAFREFGDDAQSAQVAAYNLAGMRGMRGLLAIVNQSDEQWEKLAGDVYDFAGAADKISGIRMDNYSGQVQLLKDAWDALETSVGEAFLPTATDTVMVLQDLTNGANTFVQENGDLVRGVGAGTLALGGMLTALVAAAGGVQLFSFAVNTLSLQSLLGVGGTFGIIAAAAVAAGVAVAHYTSEEYRAASAGTRLRKELEEQAEQYEKRDEASREAVRKYELEREATGRLIGELEELRREYDGSAGAAEAINEKVGELNERLPGLGADFDAATGKISKTRAEMERFNAAMSPEERGVRESRVRDLETELESYRQSLEETQTEYDAFIQEMKDSGDYEKLFTAEGRRANPQYAWDARIQSNEDYKGSIEALNESISETEEEIEKEKKALEAKVRAEMKALGISEMSVEQYETVTESVMGLAEAYEKAWSSYYEMYDGIFGTFEKVGELEKTTTGEMLQGIQSQIDYFNRYFENLEKIRTYASENGLDLSGIWGTLSDGSMEARSYTDAIVKNLQDLPGLVDKVAQDQEIKRKLADYQTELDDSVEKGLEELEETISRTVSQTGAYDEAKAAMEETLDGYLAALEGEAVTGALVRASQRWQGVIEGLYAAKGNPEPTPSSFEVNHRGYATGTENALRGWALVGEEGPELAWFGGGERVIPADRTERLLKEPSPLYRRVGGGGESAGAAPVVLNIHIPAGASAETIREARRYGEDMEKVVRRVLREERIDAKRRAFD